MVLNQQVIDRMVEFSASSDLDGTLMTPKIFPINCLHFLREYVLHHIMGLMVKFSSTSPLTLINVVN